MVSMRHIVVCFLLAGAQASSSSEGHFADDGMPTLADVSVLGLQRGYSVRRAMMRNPNMAVAVPGTSPVDELSGSSLLGLQRGPAVGSLGRNAAGGHDAAGQSAAGQLPTWADVSVLGLQRGVTPRRAATRSPASTAGADLETGSLAEMVESSALGLQRSTRRGGRARDPAWPEADGHHAAGTSEGEPVAVENASVLGFQRSMTLARPAASLLATAISAVHASVLGLQRSTHGGKIATPVEEEDLSAAG